MLDALQLILHLLPTYTVKCSVKKQIMPTGKSQTLCIEYLSFDFFRPNRLSKLPLAALPGPTASAPMPCPSLPVLKSLNSAMSCLQA